MVGDIHHLFQYSTRWHQISCWDFEYDFSTRLYTKVIINTSKCGLIDKVNHHNRRLTHNALSCIDVDETSPCTNNIWNPVVF